jgi:sialate O-acetylesterase
MALPRLRDAQLAGLALEHTAVVTALDLGDADSPFRDVHPRPKAPIGERLAAALAAQLYGITGVAHRSPMFESAALTTSGVTVVFQADSCGAGLVSRPEPKCPATLEDGICAGWELQAADGSWVAASAAVTGRERVTVTAPGLAGAPLGVRYAYASFPLVSLFSGDGLPALPFAAQL